MQHQQIVRYLVLTAVISVQALPIATLAQAPVPGKPIVAPSSTTKATKSPISQAKSFAIQAPPVPIAAAAIADNKTQPYLTPLAYDAPDMSEAPAYTATKAAPLTQETPPGSASPLPPELPKLPMWSARPVVTSTPQPTPNVTPAIPPSLATPATINALQAPVVSAPQALPAAYAGGPLDLVHSIPLEVSFYPGVPANPASATEVLSMMTETTPIVVRMETIRRASSSLSVTERDKVLTELKKRHDAQNNNPHRYFDHGYAQFVMKNNQSGLYYLRKANDTLKTPFTSLAYAMAQADVDITLENSTGDQYTTRKQDVGYKLKDAVNIDSQKHEPGFWPTFVRVLHTLKPMSAYADVVNRDYSDMYVPYGNRNVFVAQTKEPFGMLNVEAPAESKSDKKTKSQAKPTTPVASLCLQRLEPKKFPSLDWSNLQSSQTLNIINDTCPQFIQVFNVPESSAAQGKLYKVMILSNDGRPLGEFQSPVSARFLEDLNGDGIFEVVIRQYQVDPFRPVQVYRYESGQFVQDKSVESLFY